VEDNVKESHAGLIIIIPLIITVKPPENTNTPDIIDVIRKEKDIKK
jgi:hypothetical protein